jgi:hypothetical protein
LGKTESQIGIDHRPEMSIHQLAGFDSQGSGQLFQFLQFFSCSNVAMNAKKDRKTHVFGLTAAFSFRST